MNEHPASQVSWKTHLSLMLLSSRICRFVFGKYLLGHLYSQIWLEQRNMTFVLLSCLGRYHDPSFIWFILDILQKVPESIFNDKWVRLALLHVESLPGATIRERITLMQLVITEAFGLWHLAVIVASVPIDYHIYKGPNGEVYHGNKPPPDYIRISQRTKSMD